MPWLRERGVALEEEEGVVARELHQLGIGEDIADLERRESALCRAEEIAGTAEAEVRLSDLESVGG